MHQLNPADETCAGSTHACVHALQEKLPSCDSCQGLRGTKQRVVDQSWCGWHHSSSSALGLSNPKRKSHAKYHEAANSRQDADAAESYSSSKPITCIHAGDVPRELQINTNHAISMSHSFLPKGVLGGQKAIEGVCDSIAYSHAHIDITKKGSMISF